VGNLLPEGKINSELITLFNQRVENAAFLFVPIKILMTLIVGLMIGLKPTIQPIETLTWSWSRAWTGMVLGLRRWPMIGFRVGLYIGLIGGTFVTPLFVYDAASSGKLRLSQDLMQWWQVGQIAGAIAAFLIGIIVLLTSKPVIWSNHHCCDRLGLRFMGAFVSGLFAALSVGGSFALNGDNPQDILFWGLIAGLEVGCVVLLSDRLSNPLVYKLSSSTIVGLTAGCIVGLGNVLLIWLVGVSWLQVISNKLMGSWLLSGLSIGATMGLVAGLITWLRERQTDHSLRSPRPVPSDWLRQSLRKGLVHGLVIAIISGCGLGWLLVSGKTPIYQGLIAIIVTFNLGLICAPVVIFIMAGTSAIGGLSSGGVLGVLLSALSRGLSGPDIDRRIVPNQGIYQSALNIGVFALGGGLVLGWIWGLMNLAGAVLSTGLLPTPMEVLRYWLSNSLFLGLLSGFLPATACIQHVMLRIMLWRSGFAPWNYARFLNHATERLFLQKVGGRYLFIHRLLLEYLADLN
jgi:hypothetical protein